MRCSCPHCHSRFVRDPLPARVQAEVACPVCAILLRFVDDDGHDEQSLTTVQMSPDSLELISTGVPLSARLPGLRPERMGDDLIGPLSMLSGPDSVDEDSTLATAQTLPPAERLPDFQTVIRRPLPDHEPKLPPAYSAPVEPGEPAPPPPTGSTSTQLLVGFLVLVIVGLSGLTGRLLWVQASPSTGPVPSSRITVESSGSSSRLGDVVNTMIAATTTPQPSSAPSSPELSVGAPTAQIVQPEPRNRYPTVITSVPLGLRYSVAGRTGTTPAIEHIEAGVYPLSLLTTDGEQVYSEMFQVSAGDRSVFFRDVTDSVTR